MTMPQQPEIEGAGPVLCILSPVFNEEAVVPLFLERIRPVVESLSEHCRVRLVFLNNASTDRTLEVILQLRERWSSLDVISMSRNVGYQGSLDTGLRLVEADLYAIIDVDCEDPPEMLLDFMREHRAGCDIVYGQRVDRDEPWPVKQARKVFYRILRRVADDDIILDMAEFSLFTREVRNAVLAENSSFPFLRASIARVGFRRKGLPYRRLARIGGKSHYNVLGMSIFALAGILSASTLLLRLPIYAFPFWLAALCAIAVGFSLHPSIALAALGFLLAAAYLGFTAAVTALYVARGYKNGLQRPNGMIDRRASTLTG